MDSKSNSKFSLFIRKRIIALKRNYYSLPFAFVCISCFFFLSTIFVLNKSVGRNDFKPSAIFLFVSILTSILSIVAIIGYTRKEYGQKRPLKMLIIYYVVIAICVGLVITVFVFNEKQLAEEIAKLDNPELSQAARNVIQTYINYGRCSRVLMIIFFVLEAITNALLIFGPLIDKKIRSINFDAPITNEKK